MDEIRSEVLAEEERSGDMDRLIAGSASCAKRTIVELRALIDGLEELLENELPTASAQQAMISAAVRLNAEAAVVDALRYALMR